MKMKWIICVAVIIALAGYISFDEYRISSYVTRLKSCSTQINIDSDHFKYLSEGARKIIFSDKVPTYEQVLIGLNNAYVTSVSYENPLIPCPEPK